MVKLVSAKCPNCGAALRLSKEDEKTECEYCHNSIIVEDASYDKAWEYSSSGFRSF